MQLYTLLPLLLLTQAAFSTFCYSPTSLIERRFFLGTSKKVESQLICDSECTKNPECQAYEIQRFEGYVDCAFLGGVQEDFMCRKPSPVYKKVACQEPRQRCGSVGIGSDTLAVLSGLTMGDAADELEDFGSQMGIAGNILTTTVSKDCEVHYLLRNKTSVVRKYAGPTKLVESFNDVANYWGYCA